MKVAVGWVVLEVEGQLSDALNSLLLSKAPVSGFQQSSSALWLGNVGHLAAASPASHTILGNIGERRQVPFIHIFVPALPNKSSN